MCCPERCTICDRLSDYGRTVRGAYICAECLEATAPRRRLVSKEKPMMCAMCGEEHDSGRWLYDMWVCQNCLDEAKRKHSQRLPKPGIIGLGDNRVGVPTSGPRPRV